MKKLVYVQTGEVKSGNSKIILKSNGIGSCVVLTACSISKAVGCMAHIMLSGRCPANKMTSRTYYAEDAIKEIVSLMEKADCQADDIRICLIGGADVLRKKDKIGESNLKCINEALLERNLLVAGKSVGGHNRRSASLDISNKTVTFSIGNGSEQVLWKHEIENNVS